MQSHIPTRHPSQSPSLLSTPVIHFLTASNRSQGGYNAIYIHSHSHHLSLISLQAHTHHSHSKSQQKKTHSQSLFYLYTSPPGYPLPRPLIGSTHHAKCKCTSPRPRNHMLDPHKAESTLARYMQKKTVVQFPLFLLRLMTVNHRTHWLIGMQKKNAGSKCHTRTFEAANRDQIRSHKSGHHNRHEKPPESPRADATQKRTAAPVRTGMGRKQRKAMQ